MAPGRVTGSKRNRRVAIPVPNQLQARSCGLQQASGAASTSGGGRQTHACRHACAIRTVIRYRNGVLNGKGASLPDGYMEDLATDRIYRLMIGAARAAFEQHEILDDAGLPIRHTPELIQRIVRRRAGPVVAYRDNFESIPGCAESAAPRRQGSRCCSNATRWRNHQPVNAVGGQIFHVAIEQARAFPVEHSIAVANAVRIAARVPGKRCLPAPAGSGRSSGCLLESTGRAWRLVGYREYATRRFRFDRVTRQRHPSASGSFFLVFCERFQRARVSSASSRLDRAAVIPRWPASRACGRFRNRCANLEEGHVCGWCCGRAAPTRDFEIEMDQAGHVIPAAEI